MYRELGFIRVWEPMPASAHGARGAREYAYLIYPHRPIIAYMAKTRRLLGEYCVTFPDESRPYGSGRLPDSDDVLAKWMALTGDEHAADLHRQHAPAGPPGDPSQVHPRPVAPGAVGARQHARHPHAGDRHPADTLA